MDVLRNSKKVEINNFYKNTKLILVVVLITLCIGCNNNLTLNDNTIYFSKFPKKEKISFKEIYEFNNGTPNGLHLIDSTLIIFNSGRNIDFFFYNYFLNKKNISKGYLQQGRGPGETIDPWLSGINNNNIWTFDLLAKKILTINTTKALLDSTNLVFNEYRFKEQYLRMDFINDNSFFTVNNSQSEYKIQEIDLASGKLIREFGEFKNISDSNIPLELYKDIYTSYIYSKPSGGKLVLPYRYTDVIEIYDLNTEKNIAIQGPEKFNVDFDRGERKGRFYMKKNKKTKKAFVNGTVTDKYIYLIYSGHLRENENWSYGKYVYVYDWEGNPVKKIELDRYIYCLTVSKDDKTMYSFDEKTGYILEANIN